TCCCTVSRRDWSSASHIMAVSSTFSAAPTTRSVSSTSSKVRGSKLSTSGPDSNIRTVADTWEYDTAQTSQSSWVNTTSGASVATKSSFMAYRDDPRCAPPTASEISRLPHC